MDIYNYLKHKFEQFREFAIFLFMHTEATRMYIKVFYVQYIEFFI